MYLCYICISSYPEVSDLSISSYPEVSEYRKDLYLTCIDEKLKLYKIMHIIVDDFENTFIICCEISIIEFNYHYQCYEIGGSKNVIEIKKICFFSSTPLHIYTLSNGKTFLRNKVI